MLAALPFTRRRSWLGDLAAPLAVALVVRALLLTFAQTEPSWDGVIYARAAEQLARGEGYTLRILSDGNAAVPTAFYPVGFPAVLAFVRLLGGGLGADRALQALATALFVPCSYLLARRAAGRSAGRAAAWIAALWPGGIFLSATWLAEPVFALGITSSLLPIAYARRRQRPYALAIAALGLGLSAYVRPSALAIAGLLGLSLGFVWLGRQSHARRLLGSAACAGLLVLVACAPLSPWALRNYRQLGAPVLVSTNGGVNLLIGALGDGSFSTIDPNEQCKRAALREAERDRCYRKRALALITADPLAWAGRSLVKLAHTFGHDSAAAQCFSEGLRASPGARNSWRLWSLGLCRVFWLGLLSAAFAGAFLVARRAAATMRALLFAPIIALAGLHMLYLGGDRYHAGVAPMIIALAGVALARRDSRALRPTDTLPQARLDPSL